MAETQAQQEERYRDYEEAGVRTAAVMAERDALAESHAELVAALAETAQLYHYLTRVGSVSHEQSWEECIYHPCANNRAALTKARALVPADH